MYEPKVAYWPQAKSLEFFFRPLLRRAYEVWRNSTQPYLLSEFAGGRMLVVTAQDGDDVYQAAFCVEGKPTRRAGRREELPPIWPDAWGHEIHHWSGLPTLTWASLAPYSMQGVGRKTRSEHTSGRLFSVAALQALPPVRLERRRR